MKVQMLVLFLAVLVNLMGSTVATTQNGLIVSLEDDYSWHWVSEADSVDLVDTPRRASDAVKAWKTELVHHPGEYDFENEVRLYIHYQNLSSKPITGIKIDLTIRNSFNEVVLTRQFHEEVLLPPGARKETSTYWIFNDSFSLGQSPYQKLWRLAENGTAKIEVIVYAIAFQDRGIIQDYIPDVIDTE